MLAERTRKSKPDEFYCCKCKEPQRAWERQVDIKIINPNKLMIKGLCCKCNTAVNRLGTTKKLDEYKKIFDVQVIHNRHLIGCVNTNCRTD